MKGVTMLSVTIETRDYATFTISGTEGSIDTACRVLQVGLVAKQPITVKVVNGDNEATVKSEVSTDLSPIVKALMNLLTRFPQTTIVTKP